MRGHLAAVLTEFFYFQTLRRHLLVLFGMVILVLADRAGQCNEIILRHTVRWAINYLLII